MRKILRQLYDYYTATGAQLTAQKALVRLLDVLYRHMLSRRPDSEICLPMYILLIRSLQPGEWSDAHPKKVLWIDPNDIVFRARDGVQKRCGKVAGGQWDQNHEDTESKRRHQSMRAHFQYDVPWADTWYYAEWVRRAKEGRRSSWLDLESETAIREKLRKIDKLYDKINQNGYRTQKELVARNSSAAREQNNDMPPSAE